MKKITIVLFLTLLYNFSLAQIEIMKGFGLGDYAVGFKDERITDYSRSYGDDYRSVQLFVWYPTKESTMEPLRYKDYFLINDPKGEFLGPEIPKNNQDSMVLKEVKRLNQRKGSLVDFSKYKSLQTIAQRDAPVSEGSFPLLLFAPGGNTSGYFHSVICEYLASHGFVVATFPSLGNADTLRWPFDQTGLNLHLDDMALAINHLERTMDQVNIDKTGLISWSVGGVSQGIYCMKNPGIDMFISLDSGLGRTYGLEMIKESPYFNFDKFNIPYMHMTGKQPEMYQVERTTEFIDSIASEEKYFIEIEPFAHQHFAAKIGLIPALASENENKDIIEGYINMCNLTLVFTNAFLKNEKRAKKKWLELIKQDSDEK